ncbi:MULTISPECIES: NfeD family protein [unclassified Actinomyces]|uniref:NfeD family protein n=1 Tax=unclassified Actinomyces TaxID=2609248 RepID=UPI0020170DC0|nr:MULTISPECIES: NfeD family protein [unclassified Actinomyces]MCL3777582.1 NfeD family protein [Actinomyces sp. AC-20-1]MCL3789549.1 NfeD family protein [Actinomyces sp. 187325]MCL3791077.1 NfeD family protein [Actinomyces sp. 186855]MCL3793397.1 NfeD family protein [Actinomyces sp. 217892]
MAWLWWLGGALVLAVVETLSADLTFIMIAGGALGGAAAAGLGASLTVQVIVFSVVSVLLLFLVRPWAKAQLARRTPHMLTNVEAKLGREATALTAVDVHGGRVLLAGEEWSARLAEPQPGAPAPRAVPAGAHVRIVSVDGAVAVVRPE